jgi:hypothetical protein
MHNKVAEASVYISVGVVMNYMRLGPADIGLYIVQTGGPSWPFIARFARKGECAAPNFAFLAPFTGLWTDFLLTQLIVDVACFRFASMSLQPKWCVLYQTN